MFQSSLVVIVIMIHGTSDKRNSVNLLFKLHFSCVINGFELR